MTETRRVVCWRHGQTQWNLEKRFQGHSDIPLDDTGRSQAERAARLLANLRPTAIVTSDLARAADTAAALAQHTGLPATVDKDLRERRGGVWEGLTFDEIQRRWPHDNPRLQVPPDGERWPAVADRVSGAIRRGLEPVPEGGVLVVVSHGAALRAGISAMLGLPPEQSTILGPLGNCSWSMLGPSRAGGWRLLEHNAGTLPEEPVLSDDR